LPVDFSKTKVLNVSRSIYYVGFVFQIIGSILIFILLLISIFNDELAKNWNLYIIFCSTILTLFTLGLYIIVITALLFVSKAKYEIIPPNYYFYEISMKSSSFLSCLYSIFFSLIVNGLAFFALSFSANDQMRNLKKYELEAEFKAGLYNAASNFSQLNSNESLRMVNQPNFPPPPLPPPPLNRQSVSDKHYGNKARPKTKNDVIGKIKSEDEIRPEFNNTL